jgi:hypothetical protein
MPIPKPMPFMAPEQEEAEYPNPGNHISKYVPRISEASPDEQREMILRMNYLMRDRGLTLEQAGRIVQNDR